MVPSLGKKSSLKILIIILTFIFADIVFENFVVMVNEQQSYIISVLLLFVFMFLQILFAPIQAGFSDFGRKKALIISISLSLVSLVCIYLFLEKVFPYLFVLFIAITIKGVWGNTIALSWAAIADTQDKNYRASYALGSGVYAVSYLLLIIFRNLVITNYVLIISAAIILLIALFLCIFYFKDVEDKTVETNPDVESVRRSSKGISKQLMVFWLTLKEEKGKIIGDLKEKPTRQALLAYLLWSISMYSILISQVDLHQSDNSSSYIVMLMMIGYLTGVVILRLRWVFKVKDSTIVALGYYVSFFSLVPYFLFFPFVGHITVLLGICYYLHALGNAFLSPALLTIVSKEKPHHEQGKVLGLVESADTIAFMLALAFVIFYDKLRLPLVYLVAFSFISFSISWIYYSRFKENIVEPK